jgi:hypothetical protein
MTTEVTCDYVRANSSFRKGWSLSIGPQKTVELYFETDNSTTPTGESPANYLTHLQNSGLPTGVYALTSLDNNRFFRIICETRVREAATKFAETLF